LSKGLLDTLDAVNNERPTVLQNKRKHFEEEPKLNKSEKMDWIRLQAEKDRITRFKKVTTEQSKVYYGILEQFIKLLEIRKTN